MVLFRRRLLWLWLLLRPVLFFEESDSDFQGFHLLSQNYSCLSFSLSTTLTSLKFLFLSEAASQGLRASWLINQLSHVHTC